MDNMKIQVDAFLKKHGMHSDSIDIIKECEAFLDEMKNGLEGKESSLEMIMTYISPNGEIPVEDPVIVMDAGGTNFRVATVWFDSKRQPVINDFASYPMPGSTGEITKIEFYNTIVKYLEPVINKSGKIGFCFSYPTEILPNKDGRLLGFNKEVHVKDMAGEVIGLNLIKALKKAGFAGDKKIVLLNDTVATLLGGKAAYPDRLFESYIGFILGTGTNTCYSEENRNILKAPSLAAAPGSMLINTESGGFGKMHRGEMDIEFDHSTTNPGDHKFEKMVSGAYQGGMIFEILRKAIEEGLFSIQFSDSMKSVKDITSRDIDDFCYYPYSNENILAKGIGTADFAEGEKDRLALFYIIDDFFERSAKLTAVNLLSVILQTGKGKNPCKPVCIAAEGTAFYKSKLFRNKLDYYLKEYLNNRMGIYHEFVKADNATLVGTAIAGLLNL